MSVLLYLNENWQGSRAWEAYVAEAEAAGERLDPESVIPPPVPDEENIAKAPLFMRIFAENGQYRRAASKDPKHWEFVESLKMSDDGEPPQEPGHWRKGERTDLQAWAEHLGSNSETQEAASTGNPAQDVLVALTRFEPVMQELEEAAARPRSRFPVHYEDGVYMHFQVGPVLDLAKIAQLRASARLETGDAEGAYRDIRVALRAGEAIGEVRALLMYLIEMSISEMAMLPLWEGVVDHRWSDEQLRELQQVFAASNHGAAYQQAIRADRNISAFTMLDMLRRKPEDAAKILSMSDDETFRTRAVLLRVAPGGWFDLNKAEIGRLFQTMLGFADVAPPHFHPERFHVFEEHLKGRRSIGIDLRKTLARTTASVIADLVKRSASAQGTADLTLVALTLERHWLRHGTYPDALEKLDEDLRSSRGIPQDCITGGAPHYTLKPDGTYTRYYEGWNERDDGGQVEHPKKGSTLPPARDGDWVWPQPVAP